MKQPLNILHVEDSPQDSELVQHLLLRDGLECNFHRIETRVELLAALEHEDNDLILSDCTLPHFSGLQALEIANALKPNIPFIFISGTIGEETAIQSLQEGATDYVLKNRLSRLIPAVRRALAEADERTTLRAMEKRLNQVRRLEAVGRLAGGLAHDFNNLLQALDSQITLLPLVSDHPDQVRQVAETLRKATERGTRLMKELLVFARKSDARFLSLDLAEQVGDTVRQLKTELPLNIHLALRLEENLPPVFADREHLDLMLTNLVLNARDAMPQGGRITISAELIRFDPALPHFRPDDDTHYLRLNVFDTGSGMDEITRLKALEPFFTTKSRERGTGLGLSVVFGLMQIHNGFIDIQSEPGSGTVISLFFPLPRSTKMDAANVKHIPSFGY